MGARHVASAVVGVAGGCLRIRGRQDGGDDGEDAEGDEESLHLDTRGLMECSFV